MAIVKMKKLRVMAARSQRDELLKELMLLGCVELSEQDDLLDEPQTAFVVSRDYVDVTGFRTERQIFAEAIRLLDRYAPIKTPVLTPRPELGEGSFLDDSEEKTLKDAAKEVSMLDEKIKNLNADESREKLLIETLIPWKSCDLSLDEPGTKHVGVLFGTVPADTNMDKLCAELSGVLDEMQVFEISADDNARYLCIFYLREGEEVMMQTLREHSFSYPAYGTVHGAAADKIVDSLQYLEEIKSQREDAEKRIAAAARYRESFKVCYDRTGTKVERGEAAHLLLKTDNTIILEGWAAEPEEDRLIAMLERHGCAYELAEPAEEEYPEVPVKLKNNALTNGLNMVTNMYSLPQYGTVDPNPLMAPFFILFYGIMMADMGYGLLMVLMGAVILKKLKPKEGGMLYFAQLIIEAGIATFVMGAITGGLFGDAPTHIARLIDPNTTFTGLPALFNPLEDTVYVLVGAMALGLVHLVTGMAVSFAQKVKHGNVADAIWEEGTWWVLIAGILLAVLKIGTVAGVPLVLVAGILMLFYGSGRHAKGIGKVTAVFAAIYNGATGWFGDILSYSRLMALMLAGSVIAQVFNTLGAMPENIFIFIPIFIVGNALNFGLNLLGCYVHDLRLQCLEFFNKFYVDGGRPFKPLKIRSKYFDIVK